jgi:hypothetical protein
MWIIIILQVTLNILVTLIKCSIYVIKSLLYIFN